MRKHLVGALAVIALVGTLVACGGGNGGPSTVYPQPLGGGVSTATLAGATTNTSITIPASSGLGVGTVVLKGTGTVKATQSVSAPSGAQPLSVKSLRNAAKLRANASDPNSAIAYVTVLATSTTSLAGFAVDVTPTAAAPSTTIYEAYWNGTQWVTFGGTGTLSQGVITFPSATLDPAVSLTTGASFDVAVYTGDVLTTPSPPPPAPVASPPSLVLSIGIAGSISVTSGEGITITATSSNTTVATVSASANTGTGTTASFTVTPLAVGSTTLTFTDPLGQHGTATVTVNNNNPSPEPTLAAATLGLGDQVTLAVPARAGTAITASSSNSAVLSVSSTPATPDPGGHVNFVVTAAGPGSATITFSDPYGDSGTFTGVVSNIKNGAFTNGMTGWTACSFAHTALAPVNVSTPTPNQPVPTQSPGAATSAVAAGSLPPLVVTTPPANDNPTAAAISATAPPVLGSDVLLIGSTNAATQAFPKGNFGACQSVAVSANTPYLSFWVWEGGSGYSFKTVDEEVDILDQTGSTIQQTISAEQNCYLDPTNWGGSGVAATSGCWPAAYGGDSNNYQDWTGGGFWSPRGPYDLTAYAGQTVTLYVGNWSFYTDTASYYAQFIYLGNVQMLPSSTFPTSTPLHARRTYTAAMNYR